jgi:hypothetical protein
MIDSQNSYLIKRKNTLSDHKKTRKLWNYRLAEAWIEKQAQVIGDYVYVMRAKTKKTAASKKGLIQSFMIKFKWARGKLEIFIFGCGA